MGRLQSVQTGTVNAMEGVLFTLRVHMLRGEVGHPAARVRDVDSMSGALR